MTRIIKRYCLLKDGAIESCYYPDGVMRGIYKEEDGKYYLYHDKIFNFGIATCHSEILAFSDSVDELEKTYAEIERKRKEELNKVDSN